MKLAIMVSSYEALLTHCVPICAIGRFLLGVLTDIWKWHQDEQLFMQDNRVKIGGKVSYLPGFMTNFSSKAVVAIDDIVKWQNFRRACNKWHRKLIKVQLATFCASKA